MEVLFVLISGHLYTLKNYRGPPKSFGLCRLYLSVFAMLEVKTDKNVKYLFTLKIMTKA